MRIHVLSGDSLVGPFEKTGIDGEVVVCRECFVDGDTEAEGLADFWKKRSAFLAENYGGSEQDYRSKSVSEFERLERLAAGNEVVLWFEYELFCQVNLWFTIWLLKDRGASFSIAYPPMGDGSAMWDGFAFSGPDELRTGFESRKALKSGDVDLAVSLWNAFRTRDFETLGSLGHCKNEGFPTLKEVVSAACEIDTRPKETLRSIVEGGKSDFGEVFQEFNKREGVYGFGDLQVKRIFDELGSRD